MVIQRLQSLFLLIAGLLMCAMCLFVPVAQIPDAASPESMTTVYITDLWALLIINAVAAVLLFVDIFLFKNLKYQMQVTSIIMVLIVASMGIGAFVLGWRLPDEADVIWWGVGLLMVIVLALTYMAYRRMRADQLLLRSYDRLR